jgi:cytochrome P450
MDNALSMIRDDHWKRMRSIVSPTFSSGKLNKMKPIIDDCVQSLINDFNRLIKDNNEIDVKRVFGAFTMNVIIQVAFGTKVDALNDESHPIIVNAKKYFSRDFKFMDLPKLILLMKFPKICQFFNITFTTHNANQFFTELTKQLIDERTLNKSGIRRYDFLQLLLDALKTDDKDNLNKSEMLEEDKSMQTNNNCMNY